jgi:hypothetical protein
MNVTEYLLIDDPLKRLAALSEEIRIRQDEVRELSKIRAAAVVEAYEQKHRPSAIAQAGRFNESRMRQILVQARHQKTYDWSENSKATQFKKPSEY